MIAAAGRSSSIPAVDFWDTATHDSSPPVETIQVTEQPSFTDSIDGIAFQPVGVPIGGFANAAPVGGACGAAESYGGSNPVDAACQSASEVTGLGPLEGSVSMMSGNFSVSFSQLSLPGPGSSGLDLSETYNSLQAVSGAPSGALGPGWSLGVGNSLSIEHDEEGDIVSITATAGDGAEANFYPELGGVCPLGDVALGSLDSGDVPFCTAPRVQATLVEHSDGSFTYVANNTTTEQFDSCGLVTSSTDPDGNSISYTYSGNESNCTLQLSQVTNTAGRELDLSYYGDGLLQTVTEPDVPGQQVSFAYDGSGTLQSITNQLSQVTSFGYDDAHELTSLVAPNDQSSGLATVVSYVAGSPGQAQRVQDPLVRTTQFAYSGDATSSSGGTTVVTDPESNQTFALFRFGELDSLTTGYGTAASQTLFFGYDQQSSRVTYMRDPHGGLTNLAYNSAGDLTCEASPGATAQGTYCNSGGTPYVSGTTGYTYNAFHEVLTETPPVGPTTTNTYGGSAGYDLTSSTVSGTDAPSLTTSYAYYPDGQVACAAKPLGGASCPAPASGESEGAVSGATTYQYDSSGDLSQETDPDSDVSTYGYDAEGEQTCSTSPNSGQSCATSPTKATVTTYNSDGTVNTVTDPLGDTTSYEYDANGNTTEETAPPYDTAGDKSVTHTTYDEDDRPLTVTTGYESSSPSTTSYFYDEPLTTCTSAAVTTAVSGDSVTVPSSATYCDVTQDGDGNGSISDAPHNTVDYYDASSRLVAEIQPSGRQETTYAYSITCPSGAPSTAEYCNSSTDITGATTYQAYDPDGNLVYVSYSSGSPAAATYTYDLGDRRTQMADGTGTTTYSYDGDGRLVTVGFSPATGSGLSATTTTYGYDADDNVTCVSYPISSAGTCSDSGNTTGTGLVNYTFDAADRMTTMTDWLSGGQTTTFRYDGDGNLTETDYPNGDKVHAAFDQNDAMTSTYVANSGGTNLDNVNYGTRLPNGTISEEVDSYQPGVSQSYGYDSRTELIQVGGSTYASFDANGNASTYGGASSQAFNAADQLTSSTENSGTTQFTYDALGDQTSATGGAFPQASYSYNQASQLTSTMPTGGQTVASSSDHTLFVEPNGQVWAAGENLDGDLGNNSTTQPTNPVQTSFSAYSPTPVITEVAAQSGQSAALDSGGNVYVWGDNTYGEAGNNNGGNQTTPLKVTLPSGTGPISQIAVGQYFVVALSASHSVFTWGYDSVGQLGNGSHTSSDTPTQISIPCTVNSIAAGAGFAMALCSNGDVYSWGDNTYDQLGGGRSGSALVPEEVGALASIGPVASIGANAKTAIVAMGNGSVYTWGSNSSGQFGNGQVNSPSVQATPYQVPALTGIVSVAESNQSGMALQVGGQLYTWGDNAHGQLGNGHTGNSWQANGGAVDNPFTPEPVLSYGGAEIAAGGMSAFQVGANGTIQAWGYDAYGQLGNSGTSLVNAPTGLASVTATDETTDPASYVYDGDGLLVSETAGGSTEQLTWDSLGSSPVLLSDGTNDYLYGPDGLPAEQITGSSSAFYFQDALGSTRALLDGSTGAVDRTYAFNPQGQLVSSTAASATSPSTPILFAGGLLDPASGLYDLIHRYYDPTTAEFLTVDPLVDQTGEPYSYAGGDPVNAIDPTGTLFNAATGGECLVGVGDAQVCPSGRNSAGKPIYPSSNDCSNLVRQQLSGSGGCAQPAASLGSTVDTFRHDLAHFTDNVRHTAACLVIPPELGYPGGALGTGLIEGGAQAMAGGAGLIAGAFTSDDQGGLGENPVARVGTLGLGVFLVVGGAGASAVGGAITVTECF